MSFLSKVPDIYLESSYQKYKSKLLNSTKARNVIPKMRILVSVVTFTKEK